jgi:hypothetical protein
LVNEQLNPGTYEVNWNASNYTSGVYFYKLTAGEFRETRKGVKKMKKILFLLLIVHCTMNIDNCFSQWQPDVRLTNDPANSLTSLNNAWCIVASGDVVHVVWFDNRDGNYEIYYKRSTDGGVSWGADTRLTNNTAVSEYPSVAVSGSVVHVVWDENRDGNDEIYYKRSTDDGFSWGADTRLTNNTAQSWSPSVAVSGSVVHVVWSDNRDGNYEIYYKRSTDGGVSWGADTRLTINTASSVFPFVSVSGSVVHVVWRDNRDGNDEIYYKRSTDGGVSWGADTRLRINTADSWYPSVAVSGPVVHVVWHDWRDGNEEIYYKRSTDGGVSWDADTRLTNDTAASGRPSVAVSGSVVHVVWHDDRDGNPEIYYKRDPTGNVIGIINISSEIPKSFSLMQNYPNPFNPSTNIKFQLPNEAFVKLITLDILGSEIATLVNEQLNPGTYEVNWNASHHPTGVYFYRLSSGDFSQTSKMIMIK